MLLVLGVGLFGLCLGSLMATLMVLIEPCYALGQILANKIKKKFSDK